MDHVKLHLIIFNAFVLLFCMCNAETSEVMNALVQFMDNLNPGQIHREEPNWGWNISSDPCSTNWTGVYCYTNSPTVKKIILDDFNLTGILDARSLCVTERLTVLSLNSNNITGTLPFDISGCKALTHIYLHGNKLSGNLPRSLSQINNLKRIDISDNGFSGKIPDFSRISSLLSFFAESNMFTGGIPNFEFSNLEDFNVSYNNLSGRIPARLLVRFNESSFLGNQGLCGYPLVNTCPKKGSSAKDYLIYTGYAAIAILIACLIAFVIIKRRKSKKNEIASKKAFQRVQNKLSSTCSSEVKSGNRSEFSITSVESGKGSSSLVVLSNPVVNWLKFEDLLRSPAELIGRGRHGSLYKVKVNEGMDLAVKRIRDWEISKDDFEKRMWRIDGVKHPNVMPVLAFYCSKQEKLLVYQFQQNRSLFSLLHGSSNGKLFDWGSRLNVAAKISEALAFMQENLQGDRIPHGNLKSTNILFNIEMEPCLSEYGLAEVENQDQLSPAQIDSFQESNTVITQKNGFKKDSYSFGIILLELLTGKVVLNNGHDLAKWINSAIREEWTVEVFDKSLVSKGANEERMVSLLQVALKCMVSSTNDRPTMREISVMINSIKEFEEQSIVSEAS